MGLGAIFGVLNLYLRVRNPETEDSDDCKADSGTQEVDACSGCK